jgi:ABC-type microcin C transport system duplicated ATPase subunit YejF
MFCSRSRTLFVNCDKQYSNKKLFCLLKSFQKSRHVQYFIIYYFIKVNGSLCDYFIMYSTGTVYEQINLKGHL